MKKKINQQDGFYWVYDDGEIKAGKVSNGNLFFLGSGDIYDDNFVFVLRRIEIPDFTEAELSAAAEKVSADYAAAGIVSGKIGSEVEKALYRCEK